MIGRSIEHVRQLLAPLLDSGVFGELEVHAAQRIASSCVEDMSYFDVLSVACAVWATQQGHVCFDLDDTGVWGLPKSNKAKPDLDDWIRYLGTSPLVQVCSSWDDGIDRTRPLVVHDRRIYLARQWIDEEIVASGFRERRMLPTRFIESSVVDDLFDLADRGGSQYGAVLQSLGAATSILTGGPGTGKTYTIARILVAAARLGVESIALAAPTAKAAIQMRESLTAALATGIADRGDERMRVLEHLEPTTIHRLLGVRSGTSTRFRHGTSFPLPHDLIVVDEMSMVSLPMMARLLEAVGPSSTLVLVGDPGQLDSVENGSVLRDLTDVDLGASVPISVLTSSRRNIGTLSSAFSEAVRAGDVDSAMALLEHKDEDGSLRWIESSDPLGSIDQLSAMVSAWGELARQAERGEVAAVLGALGEARILCPHRDGPHGASAWNEALSQTLSSSRDRWRPGDIVVKTHNDLSQGLSNGDIGAVIRIDGQLLFVFRHGDSEVRLPTSIDESVELAFATTVHKAQGSEFATVAVVVPPAESPLCTRELLYTGLTRAKPRAVIIGSRNDIIHAISTQRRRSSGLRERLSIR